MGILMGLAVVTAFAVGVCVGFLLRGREVHIVHTTEPYVVPASAKEPEKYNRSVGDPRYSKWFDEYHAQRGRGNPWLPPRETLASHAS